MNANSTAALKAPKIVWWVIWGAMSFSIILYAVILQVLGKAGESDTAAAEGAFDLKNVLLPIAIAAVVVSFLIRFLLTARLTKSSDDKKRVLSFSAFIVSLVLAESAAIFGLLLGVMGAPMEDYLTFFGIGFLAVILQPPTILFPSKGDDYLDKLRG